VFNAGAFAGIVACVGLLLMIIIILLIVIVCLCR